MKLGKRSERGFVLPIRSVTHVFQCSYLCRLQVLLQARHPGPCRWEEACLQIWRQLARLEVGGASQCPYWVVDPVTNGSFLQETAADDSYPSTVVFARVIPRLIPTWYLRQNVMSL